MEHKETQLHQSTTYKYFAFISYNSKDSWWGKHLQRKLENYSLPAKLCAERNWKRKPISPVFYAPTDIQPGNLRSELESRLRDSLYLIVVCSPNSAKAKWVGWEIAYFHSLGRTENILFFIVDGEPHSEKPQKECLNPIVEELGIPEQLGANIHERVSWLPWINRERAYVQLVTKLLRLEFDSIWQRQKRLLRRKCIVGTSFFIAIIAIIIGVWQANQLVDVKVQLQEVSTHNDCLPLLCDAVVSITIDKETKTDTLRSIDDISILSNIPNRAIGKKAAVKVSCVNWLTIDTMLVLKEKMILNIKRDPHPYGDVTFTLWDAESWIGTPNVSVTVAGITSQSDANGTVSLTVPLDKQDTSYSVSCSLQLEDSILKMPVTENSVMKIIHRKN